MQGSIRDSATPAGLVSNDELGRYLGPHMQHPIRKLPHGKPIACRCRRGVYPLVNVQTAGSGSPVRHPPGGMPLLRTQTHQLITTCEGYTILLDWCTRGVQWWQGRSWWLEQRIGKYCCLFTALRHKCAFSIIVQGVLIKLCRCGKHTKLYSLLSPLIGLYGLSIKFHCQQPVAVNRLFRGWKQVSPA